MKFVTAQASRILWTVMGVLALLSPSVLQAQNDGEGPLMPPGPPADGTYRTLQEIWDKLETLETENAELRNVIETLNQESTEQVEPRIPLAAESPGVSIAASGTITIFQPGSYYLTDNLTVTDGDGITITASGVTLDLAGFQISTTVSTGRGISISGSNISVHSGHIVGEVAYDSQAEGDQFGGAGFTNGILSTSSAHTNLHIRRVSVKGCDQFGISLDSLESTLVESCTVDTVGSRGIQAGIVRNCIVTQCGGLGINAATVTNCRAQSVGGTGIAAQTVTGSTGTTSAASSIYAGIFASESVANSYGRSESDDGIECSGNVMNSYGYVTNNAGEGHGINAAGNVSNSIGLSESGHGITSLRTISHCHGFSSAVGTYFGLECEIAIGCTSSGGENISHKYLMP